MAGPARAGRTRSYRTRRARGGRPAARRRNRRRGGRGSHQGFSTDRLIGSALVVIVVLLLALEVSMRALSRFWLLWLLLVVLAVLLGSGRRLYQAGQREAAAEQDRLAEIEAARRSQTLESLDVMSGTAFERHVARLCLRDGFVLEQDGGGAGDLGADVIVRTPDGRRVVIQCKRYKPEHAVPGPDMQRFLGTVRNVHRADVAVFVTTAWKFTRQSRTLAENHDVVLIDRDRLGFWNTGMSLHRFLPHPDPAASWN
jgi:restriction system protein